LKSWSVELLYLSGPRWGCAPRLSPRATVASWSVTTTRVLAQDHGHGFGCIASLPLLEGADRLCDLLPHGWIERFSYDSSFATIVHLLHGHENKKADVAEHPIRCSTTSAYSLTSPPARRVALYLVIRRLHWKSRIQVVRDSPSLQSYAADLGIQ